MSNFVHPCRCGYYGDSLKPCTCTPALNQNSDPLLDRIDIHIEVPRVDYEKLSGNREGESRNAIRSRVQAARDIQQRRFSNAEHLISNNGTSPDIILNADMRAGEIREFRWLGDEGQLLMRSAMTQLKLSARAYHCIPSTGSGQA